MKNGQSPRRRGGFASMSPERRREIARLGGVASHKTGKAHEFSKEEARVAGRKGGRAGKGKSKGRSRR